MAANILKPAAGGDARAPEGHPVGQPDDLSNPATSAKTQPASSGEVADALVGCIVVSGFDYQQLEPHVASMLKERTTFILGRIANTTAIIIETGAALSGVKETLDHGQFTTWVEAELNINVRTAQRYMAPAAFAEGKND